MENEFQPQEEVLDEHQESLNNDEQVVDLEEEKQPPQSQGGKKSFEEMDKEELLAETKRYYAIAKQKSKKPEPKKQEEIIKPQNNSDITKEEIEIMFLQKDGFTEEEIEMLKTIKAGEISQGKDMSLVGATQHPLYSAYLNNKKAIELSEKAKLGASNKGGNFKEKKMTPEEHKEFAKARAQEILNNM